MIRTLLAYERLAEWVSTRVQTIETVEEGRLLQEVNAFLKEEVQVLRDEIEADRARTVGVIDNAK